MRYPRYIYSNIILDHQLPRFAMFQFGDQLVRPSGRGVGRPRRGSRIARVRELISYLVQL